MKGENHTINREPQALRKAIVLPGPPWKCYNTILPTNKIYKQIKIIMKMYIKKNITYSIQTMLPMFTSIIQVKHVYDWRQTKGVASIMHLRENLVDLAQLTRPS